MDNLRSQISEGLDMDNLRSQISEGLDMQGSTVCKYKIGDLYHIVIVYMYIKFTHSLIIIIYHSLLTNDLKST